MQGADPDAGLAQRLESLAERRLQRANIEHEARRPVARELLEDRGRDAERRRDHDYLVR